MIVFYSLFITIINKLFDIVAYNKDPEGLQLNLKMNAGGLAICQHFAIIIVSEYQTLNKLVYTGYQVYKSQFLVTLNYFAS